MKILAHRGLWIVEEEKNGFMALKKAIDNGFGIETDIRDFNGELVISHNVAEKKELLFEEFLAYYNKIHSEELLAINIKADGLQDLLKNLLMKYNIDNYFVFDMSIPEMVVNKRKLIKFYTRQSDIEKECVLYEDSCGVWLDSFYEEWINNDIIKMHLEKGKSISIISPEIHGYDKYKIWRLLKENGYGNCGRVALCTDTPEEAKEYFEL